MTIPGQGGAHSGDGAPMETLAALVSAATVRIHAPTDGYATPEPGAAGPAGPKPWGSGFFIAPSWVLTCAHVALRGGGGDVGLTYEGGTVRGRVQWAEPGAAGPGGWPAPDLALVRLLEPADHQCVMLTERVPELFTRTSVLYFGWTEEAGEPVEFSGQCSIRGRLGKDGRIRLGNEDEMPQGISGGPVVDPTRGEVIGVLKARRTGQDGGVAVSVDQLRRVSLPDGPPRGESHDLYHRVLHAHDRHHAAAHLDALGHRPTWTDVQLGLGAGHGRALSPDRRTELLGLLAELPPPASTTDLVHDIEQILGGRVEGQALAPRGRRDGLGMLYEGRLGDAELQGILRYAVRAATADHPYVEPGTEAAENALWEWTRTTATGLSRTFRNSLANERLARLRARGRGTAEERPVPVPEPEPRASVLLDVSPQFWTPHRFNWRVGVVHPNGDVQPVDEDETGVPAEALPAAVAAALTEAFRRTDGRDARAALHVALRRELFDLPVDTWRVPADAPPLGAVRPVVLRRAAGPDGDEDHEDHELRAARWQTLRTQAMTPVVLDCEDNRHVPVPPEDKLRRLPHPALPVLCHYADGTAPDGPGLGRVLDSGYDVALWRRQRLGDGRVCTEYHRGVRHAVASAAAVDRLPAEIRTLRAGIADGQPEMYWADGIVILFDDPASPLPGTGLVLEAP